MDKKRIAEGEMEVLVRGLQQEWAFESGAMAQEVLGHIAGSVKVQAHKLVLERKSGDRSIVQAGTSTLVSGNAYVVRFRTEMVPLRRFGAGVAVDPDAYYYVQMDVEERELVSNLLAGKYCVLHGTRQSGKTTLVLAAMRQLALQSDATVVYLDGLLGAKQSWSSHELWGYLHDSLYAKCPNLFPERKRDVICSDVDFRMLFHRRNLLSPVILVLDEADTLLQLQATVIAEFFATVRAMKNVRAENNLLAFLLVGVETVLDLIEAQYDKRVQNCLGSGRLYQPGSTPSKLSPFPHETLMKSERFTHKEVEALLAQAAADRPMVNLEVEPIARCIFEYTGGHKGLTGTCLAYVIQEHLWTFKAWLERAESYLLGMYVFSRQTYRRILQFIRLQESIADAHSVMLEFLAVDGLECDAQRVLQLRDFIANGVLSSTEIDGDKFYVRMSTPLLRTAILRRCTITCDRVDPPPCPTRLDPDWLLLEAVKTLDGEVMTRPEVQRARGAGSSEYIHQFLFLCRLKAILRQAYPTIDAKVLFEVKEEIVDGEPRSQLRCDSLVRHTDQASKFALEFLANGTRAQILEHLKRAVIYHDQHSAEVYVVNFCMERSGDEEQLTIPSHDSLVFVSVNFWPSKNEAAVTFVVSGGSVKSHTVRLRNWNGAISFSTLC